MFQRHFAAILLTTLVCGTASAQEYPSRAVTLIVPQSAGSGGDAVARLLSDQLAQQLGQAVVVENRPGANGVVAMSTVAKAVPDGYTVLLTGVSQMSFNPHLYDSLPYDPAKDFTYIAPVVDTPFVMVASNKSGLESVQDLIEAAKANPEHVTFSSAGNGNSTHLATEMMANQAGVKMQHVPYKGSGPALNAVLSGEIDLMTSVLGTALPQIQAGSMKPLAVLAADRVDDLPDVPTLVEAGVDAAPMPGWFAIVGPVGLDPDVVQTLNDAVQASLSEPSVTERLEQLYFVPLRGSAQEIKDRADRDSQDWGEFIERAGLKVE